MNEPLEIGDRVMLLFMDDKYGDLSPGTWGTVKGISNYQGIIQYNMSWDDGTKENPGKHISSLGLLSDADKWTKKEFKKKVKESYIITKRQLLEVNKFLEKKWIKKFKS